MELPLLSTLKLHFGKNDKISSQALKELALTLESFPSLSTLDIHFYKCIYFQKEEIKEFTSDLESHKLITILKLNFSPKECPEYLKTWIEAKPIKKSFFSWIKQ